MSHRIEQILDVLGEVRKDYRPYSNVSRLRRKAVKTVAGLWGIVETAVIDKYQRQLPPEVKNTYDFDRLVKSWLSGESMELRAVLLEHCDDPWDSDRIYAFFDAPAVAESGDVVVDESLITSSQFDEAEAPEPLPRTVITLDDDVAEVFPDSEAVNAALRTLIAIRNLVA